MTVDDGKGSAEPQAYSLSPFDRLLLQGDAPDLPSDAPQNVSKDSLTAARELAESSRRRIDTPVRKSFVRPMSESGGPVAPLAQIYSGGRSGIVAVKLYLALLWRCSAPPYSTDKPARAWATLLDLEDPRGKGARRIKNAMKALADARLITLAEQAGYPNITTLLDESGSGRSYELPSTAYNFAKRNSASTGRLAENMYFKVSPRLWSEGYIQSMSGPALVMLLILLAEQAGAGTKVWFSTEEFPRRYNISHKTRAAGTRELRESGLLTVEAESLAANPRSSTFDSQRRRKVYRLTAPAQTVAPDNLADTAPKKPKARRVRFALDETGQMNIYEEVLPAETPA